MTIKYNIVNNAVELVKNKNGTINELKVMYKLDIFSNFNNMIVEHFGKSIL